MSCSIKNKIAELTGQNPGQNVYVIKSEHQSEVRSMVQNELDRLKNTDFKLIPFELIEGEIESGIKSIYNSKNKTLRVKFDTEVMPNYLSFLEWEESQRQLEIVKEWENRNGEQLTFGFPSPINNMDLSEAANNNLPTPIVSKPVNFKEWKNNREEMIKKLEDLASRYRKLKEKVKLGQVNKAIKELKDQLKKVNSNDATVLHESLIKEIDILDDLLTLVKEDTSTGLDLLEANRVRERINDLTTYFLGTNIEGNTVSESLKELLKSTFPNEIENIAGKISLLVTKYKDSLKDSVISIYEDDKVIQEHKKVMSEDDWKNYNATALSILEKNKQSENIGIENNVLSARQVNSFVNDLLISARDANYQKEVGLTHQLLKDLHENWLKIMTLTNMQGKKLTDKLFKKDVFGVITNEIISAYNDKFSEVLSGIATYRTLFYQKQNSNSYKNWMQEFKAGVDIIEPYKLKVFYDLYKNNSAYKEFFKYSEAEMQQYEKETREKLGNTIYEIELKKQLESIKNYLFELDNNLLGSVMDKYQKNPMKFTQNFYSDNFDKPDVESSLYLEPTYISYYPKNEINQDFKKLESEEHGKELMDFWKVAHELERYTNPIFQSEGIRVKNNELINERDVFAEINNNEALKQYSFFRKIPKFIWTGIGNWIDNFSLNKDNRIKEEKGKPVRDLNLNYSSYGKNEKNVLKKWYENKPINKLYDIAKEEGLDLLKLDSIPLDIHKKTIANSLAQLELNKSSKFDMYESLKKMTEIARNINTRRNSFNISEVIKDYLRNSNLKDKTELDYVDAWVNQNIKRENFRKELVPGKLRNLQLIKKKNELEKRIEKIIEEESKSKGNYNFVLNDLLYRKIDNKYYEIEGPDRIEITKKEIEKKHTEYLASILPDFGNTFTAGTTALGVKSNMSKSSLAGFKATGGGLNRLAGMLQNQNMAITGEAGYNMEMLQWSRQFLMFDNVNKYILNIGNFSGINKLLGFEGTRKGKKLETLKLFADNFHVLETVLNDLTIESDKLNTVTNSVMDLIFDFSINNPEWKNQMELLLSIMQTIKIKDKNGNEHPIFNGKTQEFIWIPGTLQLKDEFSTDNNKLNWENFDEDESGNAPQRLLISRYKYAKISGHGNNALDDKAAIENTVTGQTTIMFIKWLAGNSFRQFGQQDISVSIGKTKIEGNKRILLKHAPSLMIYLALLRPSTNTTAVAGAFSGMTALTGLAMISSITAGITLGIGLVVGVGSLASTMYLLGVFRKNSGIKSELATSIAKPEEWLLALDMAREIAERSINIVPQYFYSTGVIKENSIKARNYKYMPSGMTQEERNLLSASAMDVAQKLGIFLTTSIASALITGIFLLFSDDDDDEIVDGAKTLEHILNMNLNIKNGVYNDINKYTNPFAFNDAATSFTYYKLLDKIRKDVFWNDGEGQTLNKKLSEGKITPEEYLSKMSVHTARLTGFPAQFAQLSTNDDATIIGDKQAYSEEDFVDEIFKSKTMNPEDNYEKLLKKTKDKHRNLIKAKIRSYYRDNNQEINEDEISDKVSKFYNQLGLTKGKKDTYQNVYENSKELDIKQAIEDVNVETLEKTKKKKRDSEDNEFSAE